MFTVVEFGFIFRVIMGHEVGFEVTGGVIDDAFGVGDIGVGCHSHWFEAHVLEAFDAIFE